MVGFSHYADIIWNVTAVASKSHSGMSKKMFPIDSLSQCTFSPLWLEGIIAKGLALIFRE